jgi:hypothetical protein
MGQTQAWLTKLQSGSRQPAVRAKAGENSGLEMASWTRDLLLSGWETMVAGFLVVRRK